MTEPLNPFGWDLPMTDRMLYEESPYAPLSDPAQNLAERLVMLTHTAYNKTIWLPRPKRYWEAFGSHVAASANSADLPAFWKSVMEGMGGAPIRSTLLLHEKNLICRPTTLPGTQVEDQEVLTALSVYWMDLRDRARMWVKTRREMRASLLVDGVEDAEVELDGEDAEQEQNA